MQICATDPFPNCFVAFDGNGNVAALINAADGTSVAQYEYCPFGELVRATGPVRGNNPWRFATKYQDDETDLVYYGHRYLKDGRWLSRDSIGELGHELVRRNRTMGMRPDDGNV